MVMPYTTTTTAHQGIVTAVDCHKQVRSWRILRAIITLLIPTCNSTVVEDQTEETAIKRKQLQQLKPDILLPNSIISPFVVTVFSFRRGKVNLCIQTASKTLNPIVLLELAVPTSTLAREMQGGVLRIALEANASYFDNHSFSLSSMPLWTMFCNGRKVGFAIKREPSKADTEALDVLSKVTVGAGVVSGKVLNRDEEGHVIYLRAKFRRTFGSSDSVSFHLIDPDANVGQELSIFFFRSKK